MAVVATVTVLTLLAGPSRAAVTDDEVRQAVAKAVEKLKSGQKSDGYWESVGGRHGGMTALAVLALLQAGQPLDTPEVRKGLTALEAVPDTETYVVALRLMAFAMADQVAEHPRYDKQIRAAVVWLERAQSKMGTWGYDLNWMGDSRLGEDAAKANTDNSNTQMALLGLYEAARAGYTVKEEVWKRSEDYFVRTQMSDGGWIYRYEGSTSQPSYGSMTAAGLATLLMTGSRLQEGSESGWDASGVARDCGKYRQNQPLAQALRWLDKNFTVQTNPGLAGVTWHYYFLYALERVGILSGQKYIGQHDWFREGAEYLVSQQKPDGGFARAGERSGPVAEYDIAFAILFLTKGHVPCLIGKLRWGAAESDWNNDRYDVEHLCRDIGDRLNGKPVGWQTVAMDAGMEEWLAAPILYITGHRAPKFTEDQKKRLRRYVDLGGTIFAEACCNKAEFADGMRKLAAEIFPESKLEPLARDHPVYHSFENLSPDWPIEGLTLGCRTAFLLSPRDLSCYWEQADKRESEAALKMGLNIAAYATARQALRERLATIELVDQTAKVELEPGALYIGKVVHQGDWNSRPLAMNALLEQLPRDAAVKVANRAIPVRLTDKKLLQLPVVYMVGHYDPQLSAEEKAALKNYLERGGFLFAESCCGMPGFDQAFRQLMADLFPKSPLEAIPPASPLFNGQVGFKITSVGYSRRVLQEQPKLHEPRLDGLKLGDRYAVIYSPYAIGPGLDQVATYQSRGYLSEDAHRLAVNIILYALKN
jgi:hypothetical protein